MPWSTLLCGFLVLVMGCSRDGRDAAKVETSAAKVETPAATSATPAAKLCARASACACPEADTCPSRLAALSGVAPPELWACAEEKLETSCETFCAPQTVQACFDRHGDALKAALDRQAAQVARSTQSERVTALCARIAGCSCADGCERELGLVEDVLPEAAWRCFDGLAAAGCQRACDAAATSSCLAPHAGAIASALRPKLTSKVCAKRAACGCPESGCEAAWASELARSDAPEQVQSLMGCSLGLDCAAMCGNWDDRSGGFQTRCVQPVMKEIARQSAMSRQMHETMMGTIRNMAPRTKVFDESGRYLYSR